MDVEPAEPNQQVTDTARGDRKPAVRNARRRRTKRKRTTAASIDAAQGSAAPQHPTEAGVAPAAGPGVDAKPEPREVAPGAAAPAKSSRRGGRKRGGARQRAARGRRASDSVPPAKADDAATRAAEAPAVREETAAGQTTSVKKPAQGRRKPKGRKRSTGDRKRSTAAEAPPAGTDELTPPEKPPKARPVPAESVDGATTAAPPEGRLPRTNREMIINVSAGEECRVAILHEGRLEELHLERQSAESHVGNIYKGRVTNVEPSIQAAFVDFGLAKNGFLHISDVQPKYFPDGKNEVENVGKKVPRRDRPPIHRCFRRGQEVIVQITKEGVGTKGPTLTTYLSIPGRYLVMMPGMHHLGVSRKIEDEDARRKMRAILNELSLPDGIGFILRTAGLDRAKRDLQRDLNYLKRLWKIVEDRIRQTRAPADLYQESDLVTRTIRDLFTPDFDRIVIDHRPTAQKAREFIQIAMPRSRNVVELYEGPEPVFHKYGIEAEIERINSHHVPLPSGGSIVIESTEAMVTIDVNSGKFRSIDDAEETAFRINLEAAKEIARQLRLRDLGGLVVCDFIDMRLDRHKRAVERTLRDALRVHKERARILRMSQFGLIEMTRQRQRPSIKRSIYSDCPHCRGSGVVKTLETMVLEVIRVLQLATHQPDVAKVTLTVSPDVAVAVLNQRRAAVHKLEQDTGKAVVIKADPIFGMDHLTQEFRDDRGRIISVYRP